MSFIAISSSSVDAKSPIDEFLLGLVKSNLDDHESRIQASESFELQFKLNGPLGGIGSTRRKRVDGGLISKSLTLSTCRILLEDGGTGGDLEIDIRKATAPDAEIKAVNALYRASVQSIARAGSSQSTQSIARATSQISTQSVARWKSSLSISSIVDMGTDPETGEHLFKLNLSGAPDSDYTGQSITVASTTGGTNDGTFTVKRVKDDGGNNLVVANASGATQTSAAGTVELNMWKYTYTNPVNSHFAAGEYVTMASHSSGGNNGSFEIYAVNQSGNNIIVKNTAGVAQASAAGTADCNRWKYAMGSSLSTTDFVVGESALAASHSSGVNDGTFPIKAVNDGGNNIVLYNASGATQGGAAGTINTCRWVYSFSTDPSADISAGDSVILTGCTTSANNGTFTAKELNRSASNNVVVYNTSGAAQVGAVGTLVTAKKKVKFGSDQSATITTDSRITIVNCPTILEDDYTVTEVNRGGGSNYNAVISTTGTTEQDGPCGRVALESKSVFDTLPKVTINAKTYNWHATHGNVSSNMVLNATRKVIAANTLVFLDVLSAPTDARNLTVQMQ